MKAEHRHELEENVLNKRLTEIADRARSGQFLNTRVYLILGAVVLLIGAYAYWLYASSEHQKQTAKMWLEFDHLNGPAGLEDFSKETKDAQISRLARLQLARVWLGPNGIQQLNSSNPETRGKAIESIERAREEFRKLAEEFGSDQTLKAQCIDGEAHAELSLVGIPKKDNPEQDRGSVDKAAELFREYAKIIGESTKPGEEATKRAEDLLANSQEVVRIARTLNLRLSPPTTDLQLPKSPLDFNPSVPPPAPPKAPENIPEPEKAGTEPKPETPAAPTPSAPAPKPETTPPPAAPTPAAPTPPAPKPETTPPPAAPTPAAPTPPAPKPDKP